jgi:small subunit ribosomal protein S5
MRDNNKREEEVKIWNPRTILGKKVEKGKITLEEIFEKGYKIREPEIVDALIPNLSSEIILIGGSPGKGGGIRRTPTKRTARMHRSGRRFKTSALVFIGNKNGYIGMAKTSGLDAKEAIAKATENAKLNLFPVKRGCGSWECGCGGNHSIPMTTEGKSGSFKIKLLSAPKGIGLCIGDEGKKIMELAGIKDIWSKSYGDTRSRINYAFAVINAFKNLNKRKQSNDKIPKKKVVKKKKLDKGAKRSN